jgi:hypothetical protein
MPLTLCELFQWYLVVSCKRCGVRQLIHRDLSKGKAVLLRSYTVRCMQCEQIDVYGPQEIERYYHEPKRRN